MDPTQDKYALWNYTWNCHVSPIRAGPEIYFIMKEAEAYSLSRYKHDNEVWKYGDKPEPPRAATSVSPRILVLSVQYIFTLHCLLGRDCKCRSLQCHLSCVHHSSLQAERTRINRSAGVFVENFNRRATQEARSQGIQFPSPMVHASESMMGTDVDPNEWDPQLFIRCQVRSWLFFLWTIFVDVFCIVYSIKHAVVGES